MSSPSSLTLIVVTNNRLARADFDSSGSTPRGFWTAGRTSGTKLPEAVGLALSLGGKTGRSVWVLCEEAWTQSLELARSQVAGLTGEQIARALSFEIEPFSGIPVSDGVLGFRETEDRSGTKTFWIVELAASQRDRIQRAVAEAGGRLVGIGHPGGVPHPIREQEAGQSWRRLESWSGTFMWVEGEPDGAVRARALATAPILPPPPDGTAFEALADDPTAAVRTLDPAISWDSFSLQDDGDLQQWLGAWAATLRRGQPAVPIILPPAPKPTARKFILAGVALEALVLAFCLWDGSRAAAERDDLKKQQAEIVRTNQETQARKKENTALQQQAAVLEDEARKRAQLAERRTSVPALLRALAATRPDDVVLSGIRPGGTAGLIVSGLALEALSVDEMCMVLNDALRPVGWSAQPMQKTAKGTLLNSGPWEFAINLSPLETRSDVKKPAGTRAGRSGR